MGEVMMFNVTCDGGNFGRIYWFNSGTNRRRFFRENCKFRSYLIGWTSNKTKCGDCFFNVYSNGYD